MADVAAAPRRREGRPLIIADVNKFNLLADEYFRSTPYLEWTITGLAVALNTSRQTLINYENRDEFFDAIKAVKDKVEMSYETGLRKRGGAGDIFGLKNFDWSDRTELAQEHTSPDGSMSPKEPANQSQLDEIMATLKSKTADAAD